MLYKQTRVFFIKKKYKKQKRIIGCLDSLEIILHNENKRYGHTAHTYSRLLFDILIWEKFISIIIGFQMTDNNTFLAVSPADLIT